MPYPAIEVSHTSKFSNELQPDERFFMGQDCNLPKQRGSRASDTSSLHSGSEGLPPSSIDDQEGMADSDDEEVYNESTGVSANVSLMFFSALWHYLYIFLHLLVNI